MVISVHAENTVTTQWHLFNRPLSGSTRVSQYQKGKTNLDLLKQEPVSGSGTMQVHTSLQTDNHSGLVFPQQINLPLI